MKVILSFLCIAFLGLQSNSQIDPLYFGLYVDKAEEPSISYLIYTMDEVEADCFLVEYNEYEEGESIYSVTAYGHCDGENGHLAIKFDGNDQPLEVSFDIADNGSKTMMLYLEGGVVTLYEAFEVMEYTNEGEDTESHEAENESMEYSNEGLDNSDQEPLDEGPQEIFFVKEDGTELILFAVDVYSIGFTLTGLTNSKCGDNGISGTLVPVNEELTLFEYTTEDGGKLEFQVSEDKINVIETNSKKFHSSSCPKWNGMFTLVQ